jgi:hypothetical protein
MKQATPGTDDEADFAGMEQEIEIGTRYSSRDSGE